MPSLMSAALDQLIIPVIHYSSQPSILCEFYQPTSRSVWGET